VGRNGGVGGDRHDPRGDLAPRDVVARAITREGMGAKPGEPRLVHLDMRHVRSVDLHQRFPGISAFLARYGLDLSRDLIPVRPAAHYLMGGVKTDLWGRTSLPGLYAAGETATTGVHGANRLASNSLLEGLVFGARAGQSMIKDSPVAKRSGSALPGSLAPMPSDAATAPLTKPTAKLSHVTQALTKIRDLMWHDAGILRSGKQLTDAVRHLHELELPTVDTPGRPEHELRNLHTLALLITRSALAREESRGSHYRSDFPYRNEDDVPKHSLKQKNKDITFES